MAFSDGLHNLKAAKKHLTRQKCPDKIRGFHGDLKAIHAINPLGKAQLLAPMLRQTLGWVSFCAIGSHTVTTTQETHA